MWDRVPHFSRFLREVGILRHHLVLFDEKPHFSHRTREMGHPARLTTGIYFGCELALPMSRTTFQLRSFCFFQMLVYLP